MRATPLLRSELEALFPEAFKTHQPRKHDTISTGISEVDLATGGIPVSTLSEICGSGKTSVLTSLLAHASHEHYCALVDGRDSFDPASADAAGANLSRLLWVRCGKSKQKLPPLEQAFAIADILLHSGGFGLVAVDLGDFSDRLLNKIEPAIWFRFARAVEKQRTALVFIEEQHHARSCAGLVLNLKTKHSPLSGTLIMQLEFEAELIRTTDKTLRSSVRPTFALRTEWA
jgi:recA bacterial DNA recombination protein